MHMRISAHGLALAKGFESFVPYVYDDKVAPIRGKYREWRRGDPIRGTLTIGYGHTDAAKFDLGFKLADVPAGFRITEAEACEILDVDLDECEQAVNDLVKVPLRQGEFDSVVDLTFNFGTGNLRKSTLLARLNRGDKKGARAAFDLYVKSKGEFMRGLQRRRDAEQLLWDEEIPVVPTEPVHHPAEVDHVEVVEPPASMVQSSEGNAAVLTSGTGATGVSLEMSRAAEKVAAKGADGVLDYVGQLAMALLASPTFWMSALVMASGAYLWFRRRSWFLAQRGG